MKSQSMCKPHQESAIYIGYEKSSHKLVEACLKCVPNLDGPFKFVENVENSIAKHKKCFMDYTNQIKLENTNALQSLVECLKVYKFQQAKKLDGIIEHIQCTIPNIEKSIQKIQNQIVNYETYDELNFIQYSEKIIEENTLGINKKIITDQLKQLFITHLPVESFNILDQILQKNTFLQIFNTLESQSTNELQMIQNQHHLSFAQKYHQFNNGFNQNMTALRSQFFKRYQKLLDKFLASSTLQEKIIDQKRKFTIERIRKHIYNQLNGSDEDELQKIIQTKQQQFSEVLKQKIKQLDDLKAQADKFQQNFDLPLLFQKYHETISILNKKLIINSTQPFEYQLQKCQTLEQSQWSHAIAINYSNSILIAGCNEKIKVFDFKNGYVVLTDTLKEHKDYVYCLQFFKQQNNFVSASHDRTIKIWSQKNNYNYSNIHTLKEHTDQIWCIAIKSNSEQIISGSRDDTIRVWELRYQEWVQDQKITGHNNSVYCLSLNETEDKLISCGKDKQILVMEYINDKWEIQQRIQSDGGKRLCFIANDMFVFQPLQSQWMQIFELNTYQKQFLKIKEVEMSGENRSDQYLFPSQFIKCKQFLINKHQNYLNILVRKDNGQFIVQQSIRFTSNDLYGIMSDDGEYLITWDNDIQKFQIRKYQEI